MGVHHFHVTWKFMSKNFSQLGALPACGWVWHLEWEDWPSTRSTGQYYIFSRPLESFGFFLKHDEAFIGLPFPFPCTLLTLKADLCRLPWRHNLAQLTAGWNLCLWILEGFPNCVIWQHFKPTAALWNEKTIHLINIFCFPSRLFLSIKCKIPDYTKAEVGCSLGMPAI